MLGCEMLSGSPYLRGNLGGRVVERGGSWGALIVWSPQSGLAQGYWLETLKGYGKGKDSD